MIKVDPMLIEKLGFHDGIECFQDCLKLTTSRFLQ